VFLLAFVKRLRCNARGSRLAIPKTNYPVETGRPHEAEFGCGQILPMMPASYTGPLMTVDLDRIARADLKEMGDIRIDDVLSFIDRGIENMPSYMDLYRRWEAQQWAVADLDFTLDRPREKSDPLVSSPVLQRRGACHLDARTVRVGRPDARDRGVPIDSDGR